MRCWLLILIPALLGSLVVGCAGHRRYNIETDGNGLLRDVVTMPADGDYNVSRHVWIRVYWPDGTEPPPSFSFALRNENDVRVHTYQHEGDQQYDWWFEPTLTLDEDSRYKIELRSEDGRVTSFFYTDYTNPTTSSLTPGPVGRTATPRIGDAKEEHVITTRQ